MKKIRFVLIQKQLGTRISHNEAEEIRGFQPHFICFPEYFFVNKRFDNQDQTPHNFRRQIQRIEKLSKNLKTVVIGGTTPELYNGNIYNTSFVFNDGELLGSYRKRNLFFTEVERITPGHTFRIFTAFGIDFGILICADVFKEESFTEMKRLGAKIIFIPTFSPKREESVEEKFKRDKDIFVQGAKISDAVIIKVCGVKSEYKEFLQARSLIANREGVIYRVNPEEEDKEMIIKKEVVI